MQRIEVPFAAQEGNAGAVQNSRETLINMYAEPSVSGRAQLLRRQRPGLEQVYALTGEKRCIEKHKGTHYLVVGDTLYSFDGTSLNTLGTISSVTGRCTMIFNDNDQIMISDGVTAYFYNGTTIATTTLPTGVFCGHLAYLGGYGIFNNPGTGQFYITGLNDFSAVDALDFATAESSPDNLVSVFVDHDELWLFGTKTIEVWVPSGSADFPFVKASNVLIERGILAEYLVAAEDNTIVFMGEDQIFYRQDGYRPVRISNTAIEEAVRQLDETVVPTGFATLYTWRGQKFVVLTWPGHLTLQVNLSTGYWNQCRTFGKDYWAVIGSNGHLADYLVSSSGICRLSRVNTDEGGTLYRGGISAPGWAAGRRMTISSVHLDAEMGRNATTSEPQLMMRFAPDGETFGNERWRSLGAIGDYRRRAIWRGVGQGRRPTLQFGITDDVELIVNTILVEASADNS